MMHLLLVFGCVSDSRESYLSDLEHCRRLDEAKACYNAARSKFGDERNRGALFSKSCRLGIDEACPRAFRDEASTMSAFLGASHAMRYCENEGKFCDVAADLMKLDGMSAEQKADLERRYANAGR